MRNSLTKILASQVYERTQNEYKLASNIGISQYQPNFYDIKIRIGQYQLNVYGIKSRKYWAYHPKSSPPGAALKQP